MLNIAIADDHSLFSQGLKQLLINEVGFNVVGIARNGLELIAIVGRCEVDLAIIDVRMPVMDGVSACRRLRIEYPKLKIIVLSMFAEIRIALELKKIGVQGYLFKDSDHTEIIGHIHGVSSGKTAFSEIKENSALALYSPVYVDGVDDILTRREIEVISLIKKGLTTGKIAAKLFISSNTVKQHRKHIFKKLQLNNIQELMTYAISHDIN